MPDVPGPETPVAGPPPRLELAAWRERWGVLAGISARGTPDDPLDMGLAGSAAVGPVLERWRQLLSAAGPCRALVASRQVHGTAIAWHDSPPGEGLTLMDRHDGHATGQAGRLLAVTVADCVPAYLLDPMQRLVALLHAGWRGTAAGILGEGIGLLVRHGSRPADLRVHLGVGICGRCYEVGPEVHAACGSPGPAGPAPLDLRAILAAQARAQGVGDVTVSSWCAAHHRDRFFSHRASGGDGARMVAYLALLP